MSKIVTAALLIFASSAAVHAAEPPALAIIPIKGPTKFFWMRIEACVKDERHAEYALCRALIDAREEGRKER